MKHYDSEGRLIAVKPLNPENTKPTPDRPFVSIFHRFNRLVYLWIDTEFHGCFKAVPYMIGQERFCRVLREHLKKSEVEVEFSSELLSTEQRNDDVITIIKKGDRTESIESLFVVGADGARGASSSCFTSRHASMATTSLTCSRAYKVLYADN